MERVPPTDPAGPEARRAARQAARRRRILVRRAVLLAVVAGLAVGVVAVVSGGIGGEGSADATGEPASGGAAGVTTPPPRTPPPDAPPVSIAATGDIVMGSDGYGLPSDGGASFFGEVGELLAGDVVVGNLEGTLAVGGTSKCGEGSTDCFAFRTPPSYARWLREAGFTVMNLANNHAYDFGAEGQRETLAALRRVGLRNTGRPGTVAVQSVRGVRVAVLGFAPYDWADPLLDIPAARRRVEEAAARNDIVIVTFHGGAEGRDRTHVPEASEDYLGEDRGDLRAFGHAVVEAGADLVVGHGPHVLRGMELYRGRLVAYSLGNFGGYEVFGLNATTATSAVLQASIAPDGRLVSARVRPTRLVGAGTPAPGGDGIALIREVSREDFGARGVRLEDDGTIRVPGR